MGEIKELEEAREAGIDALEGWGYDISPSTRGRMFDEIFNLKGADWKIAIVGNWSYTNPDGNKYAQVIWQTGE